MTCTRSRARLPSRDEVKLNKNPKLRADKFNAMVLFGHNPLSLSLLALLLRSLNMNASPKRAQTEQESPKPGKFSRKMKKNSPPPQMKEPVIIYLTSPERIYVEPEEFKAVVQRLTGSSSAAVAAAAAAPPPSEESSSADGVPEEFDQPDCFSCLSPLNLHLPQDSVRYSDDFSLTTSSAIFHCKV